MLSSDEPDDTSWWRNIMDAPVAQRPMLQRIRDAEMKAKGEAIGRVKAKIYATQWHLQLLITSRFGGIPGPLLHYIYYVRDPERLERAFRQALTLEKLEDLRI